MTNQLTIRTLYNWLLLLLISALQFLNHDISAQEMTFKGSIQGEIIDQATLQALPFCTVSLIGTEMSVSSDAHGAFIIEDIPEGKYDVRASFTGYKDKSVSEIRVVREKTIYLNLELYVAENTMETIDVIAYKFEDISSMPTGTYSLSREEIFRSPASNGNIFKAISVIPGVQSGGGSFSALAVRGQGSEENVMFVDGFPIYDLSHLSGGAGNGISGGFDDPNGGRFSIFGPRVIDGLVIQTGGFSSLYGRKSASYLSLDVKEGNPIDTEMDALISLTGASVSYSGPSFGSSSSLFASIRYQNFVPALNLTNQGELGSPSFSDLTLKNVVKINDKNKLTFLALLNPEWFSRSTKHIAKDNKLQNVLIAEAKNYKGLIGASLTTLLNKKSTWKNYVYYRKKKSDLQFGKAYPQFGENNSLPPEDEIPFNNNKGLLFNIEDELGMRSVHSVSINENIKMQSGLEFSRISVDHSRTLNELDTLFSFYREELPADQQDQNYFIINPEYFNSEFVAETYDVGGFTNMQYKAIQNLTLNMGVRYDYTGFSEVGNVSPRFSLKYAINDKSSINAATGIYYQDPLFINIADNSGQSLDPEKVIHYILGYKYYLRADLKLTFETYYKTLEDLIVRPNTGLNQMNNQGDGEAYGFELSLVKRLSNRYNGQLSYAYSQSTRNNNDGKGEYDHLYSQPHLVNFLLSYQPNSNIIISGKFRYSTGQPSNSSIIYENVLNNEINPTYGQELLGINDVRNDDFIGVDLRFDRRFQLKNTAANLFVDIQNVFNFTNASTRTFFENTGEYEPQALGILPTVGWRFEF